MILKKGEITMINTIENKNVTIFTSNFKISGKNPNAVSIAQGNPQNYIGREYRDLAPSWSLIKRFKNGDIDPAGYEIEYRRDVLGKLDPAKVIEELRPNAVLLCWCKPDEFCHRRIVALWLKETLGINVPEYVPVPLTAIY